MDLAIWLVCPECGTEGGREMFSPNIDSVFQCPNCGCEFEIDLNAGNEGQNQ